MKRLQVGRAAETYVLASREKIGTASRFQVVGFDAVTAVIADPDSAAAPLADLAAAGVAVTLAPWTADCSSRAIGIGIDREQQLVHRVPPSARRS